MFFRNACFSSDLQDKVLSRRPWCGDNSELLQHAQRIKIELFLYEDDVGLPFSVTDCWHRDAEFHANDRSGCDLSWVVAKMGMMR